jgi:hypothetical protein
MDNLVNEGVLKPKKLEESKKLINKRIEEWLYGRYNSSYLNCSWNRSYFYS